MLCELVTHLNPAGRSVVGRPTVTQHPPARREGLAALGRACLLPARAGPLAREVLMRREVLALIAADRCSEKRSSGPPFFSAF
jgi:hypothetical protein